jgi:hypothetical protein
MGTRKEIDTELLISMAEDGRTTEDIAMALHICHTTAFKLLKRLGYTEARKRVNIKQIDSLLVCGKKAVEVSAIAGCSLSVVSKRKQALGFPAGRKLKRTPYPVADLSPFIPVSKREELAAAAMKEKLGLGEEAFQKWRGGKVFSLTMGFVERGRA